MPRRLVLYLLLAAAAWHLGAGAYTYAKAGLAQVLLERAWEQTRHGSGHARPWGWSDTWPVARLHLPGLDKSLVVLEGASGRNLAFGPGHLSSTPLPGNSGNSVIAGHRDTHFAALAQLRPGDTLSIELATRVLHYRVRSVAVVHESATYVLDDSGDETLTLLTCYPFNAVRPGTDLRFVVTADVQHAVGRGDGQRKTSDPSLPFPDTALAILQGR